MVNHSKSGWFSYGCRLVIIKSPSSEGVSLWNLNNCWNLMIDGVVKQLFD